MKILVIGTHADDEVIGLGGTIIKHVEKGDDVYLSIMTDSVGAKTSGEEKFIDAEKRRTACLKVAKFLGIKEVFFHDLPDARLDSMPQLEINKIIESDIEKIKPQRIYTHSYSDLHSDHRAVLDSTLVATRKKVPEVFCYEIIGSTNKRKGSGNFSPNYYVNISGQLGKKLKAMSFYTSVVQEFPGALSLEALETIAKYRGIESGFSAAEAFECIKMIWK
jgi:LmbE family N-acetylglucosaminyl deacetylase